MKTMLLAAIAAALFAAPPASALSKNNNGATLNVSPAQPVVGDSVSFSGCNYQPNFVLTLVVQADNKFGPEVFVTVVVTDAFGCFATTTPFVPASTGNFYAAAWFGNGHRVAALDFSVT